MKLKKSTIAVLASLSTISGSSLGHTAYEIDASLQSQGKGYIRGNSLWALYDHKDNVGFLNVALMLAGEELKTDAIDKELNLALGYRTLKDDFVYGIAAGIDIRRDHNISKTVYQFAVSADMASENFKTGINLYYPYQDKSLPNGQKDYISTKTTEVSAQHDKGDTVISEKDNVSASAYILKKGFDVSFKRKLSINSESFPVWIEGMYFYFQNKHKHEGEERGSVNGIRVSGIVEFSDNFDVKVMYESNSDKENIIKGFVKYKGGFFTKANNQSKLADKLYDPLYRDVDIVGGIVKSKPVEKVKEVARLKGNFAVVDLSDSDTGVTFSGDARLEKVALSKYKDASKTEIAYLEKVDGAYTVKTVDLAADDSSDVAKRVMRKLLDSADDISAETFQVDSEIVAILDRYAVSEEDREKFAKFKKKAAIIAAENIAEKKDLATEIRNPFAGLAVDKIKQILESYDGSLSEALDTEIFGDFDTDFLDSDGEVKYKLHEKNDNTGYAKVFAKGSALEIAADNALTEFSPTKLDENGEKVSGSATGSIAQRVKYNGLLAATLWKANTLHQYLTDARLVASELVHDKIDADLKKLANIATVIEKSLNEHFAEMEAVRGNVADSFNTADLAPESDGNADSGSGLEGIIAVMFKSSGSKLSPDDLTNFDLFVTEGEQGKQIRSFGGIEGYGQNTDEEGTIIETTIIETTITPEILKNTIIPMIYGVGKIDFKTKTEEFQGYLDHDEVEGEDGELIHVEPTAFDSSFKDGVTAQEVFARFNKYDLKLLSKPEFFEYIINAYVLNDRGLVREDEGEDFEYAKNVSDFFRIERPRFLVPFNILYDYGTTQDELFEEGDGVPRTTDVLNIFSDLYKSSLDSKNVQELIEITSRASMIIDAEKINRLASLIFDDAFAIRYSAPKVEESTEEQKVAEEELTEEQKLTGEVLDAIIAIRDSEKGKKLGFFAEYYDSKQQPLDKEGIKKFLFEKAQRASANILYSVQYIEDAGEEEGFEAEGDDAPVAKKYIMAVKSKGADDVQIPLFFNSSIVTDTLKVTAGSESTGFESAFEFDVDDNIFSVLNTSVDRNYMVAFKTTDGDSYTIHVISNKEEMPEDKQDALELIKSLQASDHAGLKQLAVSLRTGGDAEKQDLKEYTPEGYEIVKEFGSLATSRFSKDLEGITELKTLIAGDDAESALSISEVFSKVFAKGKASKLTKTSPDIYDTVLERLNADVGEGLDDDEHKAAVEKLIDDVSASQQYYYERNKQLIQILKAEFLSDKPVDFENVLQDDFKYIDEVKQLLNGEASAKDALLQAIKDQSSLEEKTISTEQLNALAALAFIQDDLFLLISVDKSFKADGAAVQPANLQGMIASLEALRRNVNAYTLGERKMSQGEVAQLKKLNENLASYYLKIDDSVISELDKKVYTNPQDGDEALTEEQKAKVDGFFANIESLQDVLKAKQARITPDLDEATFLRLMLAASILELVDNLYEDEDEDSLDGEALDQIRESLTREEHTESDVNQDKKAAKILTKGLTECDFGIVVAAGEKIKTLSLNTKYITLMKTGKDKLERLFGEEDDPTKGNLIAELQAEFPEETRLAVELKFMEFFAKAIKDKKQDSTFLTAISPQQPIQGFKDAYKKAVRFLKAKYLTPKSK